ncbi:MAG: cellulase family glycosylhydrolase [Anaerolineales bacterium]
MKRLIPPLAVLAIVTVAGLACKASGTPIPQTPYSDHQPDNPMVHQVGRSLIDPNGQPLRLRGVNLGGWLLWEGWDFSKGSDLSENTIDQGVIKLVGQDALDRFHQQVYENFITEADIRAIEGLGFNSVRLPINYNILEDDSRPYVYLDSGWRMIDQALTWCEKYNLYVILDLHAVPGGQSGLPPSNPSPGEPRIWFSPDDQARTVALWKAIAERYRGRTVVAGYDLINEPLPSNGNKLILLYQRIIPVIRQVDPDHLLVLEGTAFSGNFDAFTGPLFENEMYGFHMYNWFGDNRKKKLDQFQEISRAQNVPLWAGEFGDNTYAMIGSTVAMYENSGNGVTAGWPFWTWKKVPGKYPALATITVPDGWQAVFNLISNPKKNPQPSLAEAQAGMDEFVHAVQLRNTPIDPQMAQALTGNWQ